MPEVGCLQTGHVEGAVQQDKILGWVEMRTLHVESRSRSKRDIRVVSKNVESLRR